MQSLSGQVKHDSRHEFYRQVIGTLERCNVPFLIGGAFGLEYHTGISRQSKDLDIFIYPKDSEKVLDVFSGAGYRTELTASHWLGKIFYEDEFVDLIFSSGNGVAEVDEGWFENSAEGEIFGMPVRFTPPEEMIWSKAFVMERDRYDGADIAHVLQACGENLDWQRLLGRFGAHWRVIFSHLILFGFIYPSERSKVPDWVMHDLIDRSQSEMNSPPPQAQICYGTLFSTLQYVIDVEQRGYSDPRLSPSGNLTEEQVARFAESLVKGEKKESGARSRKPE